MRHYDDVFAALKLADDRFDSLGVEFLLEVEGAHELEAAVRWSQINEQAYFLLLFSQFEAEVNRICGELIRYNQSHANWIERRCWDILDASSEERMRNLNFLKRVALLTDKGGPVYKRVKELYDTRNRIAHGDLLARTLDVTEIAKEIQRIAEQLKGPL